MRNRGATSDIAAVPTEVSLKMKTESECRKRLVGPLAASCINYNAPNDAARLHATVLLRNFSQKKTTVLIHAMKNHNRQTQNNKNNHFRSFPV